MHILPVNNNNNTNFQRLKIDRDLMAPLLKNESPEFITKLNEFGKTLREIKRFNVVLIDSLTPKVIAVDKEQYGHKDYFAEFKKKIEPYLGKPYMYTSGDETVQGHHPDVPRIFTEVYKNINDAKLEYHKFKQLDTYEQAGELSRLLDEKAAAEEEKALTEKIEAEKKREMERLMKLEKEEQVAKLMEEYGVNTDEKNVESLPQPKPSFWENAKKFISKILN